MTPELAEMYPSMVVEKVTTLPVPRGTPVEEIAEQRALRQQYPSMFERNGEAKATQETLGPNRRELRQERAKLLERYPTMAQDGEQRPDTQAKELIPEDRTRLNEQYPTMETAERRDVQASAPNDIRIELPHGMEADQAALGEFKKVAKQVGIDGKVASKLIAWDHQRTEAAIDARNAQWMAEVRADKEIGGVALDSNLRSVRVMLARHGGQEVMRDLDALGIGNVPSLVRLLVRLSKKVR